MKKDFKIEDIKVIQAPLAGVSDCVFRGLIREYGSNCLLTTEMLSAEALNNCPNPKGAILKFEDIEYPISFQLVGHKPQMMAKCAKLLEERASAIDLNFGCPVQKVVKSGDGSAMMKTPQIACDIVKAIKDVINIPLSAKFRLGWSSDSENYLEFGKMLEVAGVDYVVLHARTRSQLYSGSADWEKIGKLKKELKIPVFGNGDIKTLDDAINALNLSKADGIAIGRGIMGDFSLPKRIEDYITKGVKMSEPDLIEKIKMLRIHLEREIELRGERVAIPFIRKFYGFYISGVKNASKYRQVLVTLNDLDEIYKNLDLIADEVCQNV